MPQMTDTIQTKPRSDSGKGAARKLRSSGHVPAIAYGPGTKETQYLSLDPKAFGLQRAQFGSSHLYDVTVEGGKGFKALVREIQINPIKSEILHVDLYAIDVNKPIRVDVVLELEGKHAGAIDGGILQQVLRKITIECLPLKIPNKLTADVSPLKISESLHVSDVKLPEGVKLITGEEEAIAVVVAPQEEEAAPVAAAAAEGAAAPGAEGAAAAGAAPAAGAAAGKEGEKKEGGKK